MTDDARPAPGDIGWVDLTVEDADAIRDFYTHVVGWQSATVDMPGYTDYNMIVPESLEPVAGICYARGANAGIPAQWMIYIVVEDVDLSARLCESHGGRVLSAPRSVAGARLCVISDPAGAVCTLYQPPEPAA
jgi:predicted enzyme related to lactoylglutathione lyase